jgi:hypothetical protein
MKKGVKYQRWKGLHIKPHQLSWFVDRIGKEIYGACPQPLKIINKEQCETYYNNQYEFEARYTEYPR